MNLLVRAELRKTALRPATWIIIAVFLLAMLFITWTAQGFTHLQWRSTAAAVAFDKAGGGCWGTAAAVAKCRADAIAYNLPTDLSVFRSSVAAARTAAPGQSPLGAIGWAAGVFASVPGLLAAFLLAAANTAAEWERGTAARLFLAENRISRVFAAKALAVWATLMAAVVLAGAVAALYDIAYTQHAYPLTAFIPSTWRLVAYTARRTLGAGLLLAGAAATGVLAAARWRTRGSVIATGIVCALAANLGIAWPGVWSWLPGGTLASLMGFTTQLGVWDHLWGNQVAPADPLLPARLAVAALLAVLPAVCLARGLRNQDLI